MHAAERAKLAAKYAKLGGNRALLETEWAPFGAE